MAERATNVSKLQVARSHANDTSGSNRHVSHACPHKLRAGQSRPPDSGRKHIFRPACRTLLSL
jgi:hypothetical protein